MIADPREMKLGLADYLALPEDEDREREIIRGKLYVTPGANYDHQIVLKRLDRLLTAYIEMQGGDDFQVVQDTDLLIDSRKTYVTPDLMYFDDQQTSALLHTKRTRGRIDMTSVSPTLVVEILSEGNRARDLVEKLNEYEQAGIRHYWIIDPQEHSFREFVLDEATGRYQMFASAGGVVRPQLFAGNEPPFDLDLDSLFR